MDARGAKEDLMNRCCIMPNEAKYPLPSRVEQLKAKKKSSSQAGQKYEGMNYSLRFFYQKVVKNQCWFSEISGTCVSSINSFKNDAKKPFLC